MRSHLIAQTLDRQNRVKGVTPGHEVFRLELFAGAGSEAHAEVGQPLVPGAGHSHLLGAVLGGELGNGVKISGRELRAEEFRGRRECLTVFDTALDPELINSLFLPVGEQTDAVGARQNFVEVLLHLSERQILKHVLPHGISGLNIESNAGDDAESAEPHDSAAKDFAI